MEERDILLKTTESLNATIRRPSRQMLTYFLHFLHFLHQYAASILYPALIFGVSWPDTRSIKAGYSEYQGKILVFDTFVKIPIMPSLVQEMQEMQEMQDFAQL